MNTIWADRRGVLHDDLATDLAQARLLRDALRLLADVRTAADQTRADAAVATVNAIAAAGHYPPRMGWRDGRLITEVAPNDPRAALSDIAVQGIALLTDPDSPLRACHGPGCVLFFIRDHQRREWCSAGCGNRARAARHYRRHRQTG